MTRRDYGYNQVEASWGDTYMLGADADKAMAGIQAIGGSRIRLGVQVGTLDDLDRSIALAIKYGLKPLIVTIGNPTISTPVDTVAGFAAQCKLIADRYGPNGVGARKNTVSEIEIGNEPNSSLNPPHVDAAGYTQYLKASYIAIKSVNPSCQVIAAGTIPAPDIGSIPIPILTFPFFTIASATNPVTWYRQIYAAGGKNYFDVLGFHLYTEENPTLATRQVKYLTDIRQLMIDNGDTDKKVWVTEVGVGYPGTQNITTPVIARDWLKGMMDILFSLPYVELIYIYNYRNSTKGGDSGAESGNAYGITTFDFTPKSPIYEYMNTISDAPVGPSDPPPPPSDVTPPSPPTGVGSSDATATTAKLYWNQNPALDGVTNYRVYTAAGALVVDTPGTFGTLTGLMSGSPLRFYVTAIDLAGNESAPSALASVTTSAPTGQQAVFGYVFTGSVLPTVFAQLGLGFSVSGGVALHNSPSGGGADGSYITVAPYNLDQLSPDHSSRVSLAGTAAKADRSALAFVRMSPDGTAGVFASAPGGGQADSLIIWTLMGGQLARRAAVDTSPATSGQDLFITVTGNVYVARIIAAGVVLAEATWSDTTGVYSGATNRRAGIGWQHLHVGGVEYPAPGITSWAATDVGTVQAAADGFEPWMLPLVSEGDWPELFALGDWELLV